MSWRRQTCLHVARFRPRLLAVAVTLVGVTLIGERCRAQLCGQLNGTNFTQNFNTLAASGSNNSAMPIGFAFVLQNVRQMR